MIEHLLPAACAGKPVLGLVIRTSGTNLSLTRLAADLGNSLVRPIRFRCQKSTLSLTESRALGLLKPAGALQIGARPASGSMPPQKSDSEPETANEIWWS